MESLELTAFGHAAHTIVCVVESLSLSDRQIEVDITVALQIVSLDLLAKEVEDLILDLVVVHE